MIPDQPLTIAELEAIEARSARLRRRIRAVVALPGEKVMPDTLGVPVLLPPVKKTFVMFEL